MEVLNKATARVIGAAEQVADAAAPGVQWLEEQSESLAANGSKLVAKTGKYIAAHPLQSIAVALVAGYLISRITR
jgi:ElaB/YqjD/DUF883 family membrane-anchored ribosome-binding protein